MSITEGKPAPEFTLQDGDDNTRSLSDFAGKTLVIYFYPKDNTPGCTKEACGFRDDYSRLTAAGVEVLGVSKDSVASHKKFTDKFDLPFPLLSDPEGKMLEAYGAWGEKKNYGKTYMGIIRSTVIIGPDGNVLKHWPIVRKAADHPEKVAEFLGL